MKRSHLPPLFACALVGACSDPSDQPGLDDTEPAAETTMTPDSSSSSPTSVATTEGSSSGAEESTTAVVDDGSSSESGGALLCGNGELDDGEVCDDGNAVDGDGCNVDCVASGTLLDAWIVDDLEQSASPRALATGSDGSFAVVGVVMRTDIGEGANGWIRKYRGDGTTAWTDSYNNDLANGPDVFSGVDIDQGGDIVVVGSERRSDLEQGDNALLRRYDADGVEQWTVAYNTPDANGDDVFSGVGFDDAGDIYVGGHVFRQDLGQSADYWIAGYTPDGAADWSTTIDSPAHAADVCLAFTVDGAGNGYCAGQNDRSDLGHGQDGVVVKTSPTGDVEWTHAYNDAVDGGDGFSAVAAGQGGELVIAGLEQTDAPMTTLRAWVRKLDADGNEVWTHTYDGTPGLWVIAYAAAVDAAGDVVVGGYEMTAGGGFDTWVRKLDGDGNTLWTDVVDLGEGNERAVDAEVLPDGRILVTGFVDVVGDDALSQIWVRVYAP